MDAGPEDGLYGLPDEYAVGPGGMQGSTFTPGACGLSKNPKLCQPSILDIQEQIKHNPESLVGAGPCLDLLLRIKAAGFHQLLLP